MGLFLQLLLPFLLTDLATALRCGFPGAPAHSTVEFSTPTIEPGTVARYSCDRGFELLGPTRRLCGDNGTWVPQGIPFCVLNVAAGKAPMQSSVAGKGIPQKAVDGLTSTFFDESTCTMTEVERSPWWYVNLLEPYMVQLVRIDFGKSCCAKSRSANIVVRVGNNRPDLGVNPICNRFTGSLEEGRPLFLPCNPPMPGAFVSVHFEGPPGVSLSICEAFVYTDQALPIERCPSFRDQPPGSTATYNGKCYIFYNKQPADFQAALDFCEERGGSLVDESNPALQGFLSWELWRRHKGDANGQYWLGVMRDREDPKNWKWINGKPVAVSFWNLPGGNDNCARFDGTKGWLWSDTNCGLHLNFICQHRPTTCGKPEQPPNSTLIARKFNVGSRIEYSCDKGHLLVGPSQRSCLATGFYSEFPPVCRFLECGTPAEVERSELTFLNASNPRGFQSYIRYECAPGYIAVGRTLLMCDVDERWDGPPPRCDPVYCPEPRPIRHGGMSLSTNTTEFGSVLTYYCSSPRHVLVGRPKLVCSEDGSWNGRTPSCRLKDRNDPLDKLLEMKSGEGKAGPSSIPPPPRFRTRERKKPFSRIPAVERHPNPNKPAQARRPIVPIRENSEFASQPPLLPRPYPGPEVRQDISEIAAERFPIDNEIPDANIQANPDPGANVPLSVQNDRESRQQRLNLGGIIALGVFGGFVFLAAIITTIVILIRRKEPKQDVTSPRHHLRHQHDELSLSGTSTSSSESPTHSQRNRLDSEEVRDAPELVLHSYSKTEKSNHSKPPSSRHKHHHHHHHHHKHRHHRSNGGEH